MLEKHSADGTLESWTRNAAGQVDTYTDQLGFKTFYVYSGGDLTRIASPDGGEVGYAYHPYFDKVTKETRLIAPGTVATTKYLYNAMGDLTFKTEAAGTAYAATTSYVVECQAFGRAGHCK